MQTLLTFFEELGVLSVSLPEGRKPYILWRIDPLLGRDLETDEYSHCYAIGG
jgi:hypothetical protein